jgi:hypothetical protein
LPGGVRNSEGGSYTGVYFFSHPYRGAVKGGSEAALDSDAILSGTPSPADAGLFLCLRISVFRLLSVSRHYLWVCVP